MKTSSTLNQATLPRESSRRELLPRPGNGEHKLNCTAIATNGTPAPALKAQVSPRLVAPWLNPTQLERPAFLLNFPFSYATGSANNPWMQDLTPDKRRPDFTRAS